MNNNPRETIIVNRITFNKVGREFIHCSGCDKSFIIDKKTKRVDMIAVLGVRSDGARTVKFQCIECSGGCEAVMNYLKALR